MALTSLVNPKSSTPMYTEMKILETNTISVSLKVSWRVGQTTLESSVRTSLRNVVAPPKLFLDLGLLDISF